MALAAGVALVAPVATANAQPPSPAARKDPRSACVQGALRGVRSGRHAVDQLGSNLPAAASAAGWSVRQLKHTLATDHRFRVDACAHTFVVDDPAPKTQRRAYAKAGAAATGAPATGTTLSTSGDAFALNSRPGAQRTIYLDFDGATISGTSWNDAYNAGASWVAPAFSSDADPTTFTDAERTIIKDTWLRVAEDYSPFNVNVTTATPDPAALQRTDSSDQVYGVTALITNDTVLYNQCGCGGIAYIGVFGYTGAQRYQPAFVFQRGLGASAKNLAEAASHEVGHNLGLSHDGTVAHDTTAAQGYYAGQGAWAPIMGVGYYAPVTQWSRGEYQYASQTQDDLSVIVSNGAPLMTDDHTDSAAGASALATLVPVDGLVGTRADQDWFAFSASGATTVSVAPQSVGADLDVKLTVKDANGNTVGTVDPAVAKVSSVSATGLNATYTFTADPGTYYAVVDGIGFGDPLTTGYSDYASLGRYAISLTTSGTPTNPLQATTTSLPGASVGTAYSAGLAATGGTAPYTWSVASGSLPPGLSLSGSGAISGTPTAAGSFSASFAVTDSASGTATTPSITITVAPAQVIPVTVTTTSLPGGTVGTSYSRTLAASGGTAPYTWSVATGSLPPGLTLSSGGAITGTPTTAGTYSVAFRATDTLTAAGTSGTITITIAPAVAPLTVKSTSLPSGYRYYSYRATLTAGGGKTPYTWSVTAGSLPRGLSLSSSGVISGTPTRAGYWDATYRVRDSAGRTASRTLRITIR